MLTIDLTQAQRQAALDVQAALSDAEIIDAMYREADYKLLKARFLGAAQRDLVRDLNNRPDCEWESVFKSLRRSLTASIADHYRDKLAASGELLDVAVERVAGWEEEA